MISIETVNDTLRFLVPILRVTKDYNNELLFNENLVGAYTGDILYPEMDDKLLLIYKYDLTDEWAKFSEKLKAHPFYTASYEYEIEDLVVFAFDIPEEYKEDYAKINSEQYDSINPSLKLLINKFWDLDEGDVLFKVIAGEIDYEGEGIEDQTFNIATYGNSDLSEQIDQALRAEEREEIL
jgi:hypothetical protein